MINKNIEPYYDLMLNIFLGIIVILIIYSLYDSPRIVVVEESKESKESKENKESQKSNESKETEKFKNINNTK